MAKRRGGSPVILFLEVLACPDCDMHLGSIISVNDKTFLEVGIWRVPEGKCRCPRCSKFIHWKPERKKREVPRIDFGGVDKGVVSEGDGND